jgi:ACR3 family arsenite transporter
LPGWIIAAITAGLELGRLLPEVAGDLNTVTVGLLLMMYPVLAKVRYRQLGRDR